MEVNLNSAVRRLQSVDKQLKDMAKVPANGKAPSALDSIDISLEGLQGKGGIKSPTASALYSELSQQLGKLTDFIDDSSGQQKKLTGLFKDPNNTNEVQARAKELLDGYFNVENTSERIFNFAFSFYDGSKDKETFAREMQGHIHEGFAQAEKAMGGLADISLETRDRIDEMVDSFINEDKEEGENPSSIEIEA